MQARPWRNEEEFKAAVVALATVAATVGRAVAYPYLPCELDWVGGKPAKSQVRVHGPKCGEGPSFDVLERPSSKGFALLTPPCPVVSPFPHLLAPAAGACHTQTLPLRLPDHRFLATDSPWANLTCLWASYLWPKCVKRHKTLWPGGMLPMELEHYTADLQQRGGQPHTLALNGSSSMSAEQVRRAGEYQHALAHTYSCLCFITRFASTAWPQRCCEKGA